MFLAILLHVAMLADYAGGTQTSPHIPRDPGIVDGRISCAFGTRARDDGIVCVQLEYGRYWANYVLWRRRMTARAYRAMFPVSFCSVPCEHLHQRAIPCDHMQGAGLINGTETKVWCPRKDTPYEYYQISIREVAQRLEASSFKVTQLATLHLPYRHGLAIIRDYR